MFKFSRLIVLGFIIGGLLSGCASGEKTSGNEEPKEETKAAGQELADQNEEKDAEPKYDDIEDSDFVDVGQVTQEEEGTAELLKIKTVNETVDIAPLKVTVNDMKIVKVNDVDSTFAENLANNARVDISEVEDGFSYVQVQFTAENTSEANIQWYDLVNVVTDKGEQIDAEVKDFMYDDAESDSVFIGKVKKEYTDGFLVKDDQINSLKLIFGNTEDEDSNEEITDEQTVEYTFD